MENLPTTNATLSNQTVTFGSLGNVNFGVAWKDLDESWDSYSASWDSFTDTANLTNL